MPGNNNYEGFDTDIKTCFAGIITTYDFQFHMISEGIYQLKNDNCILTFDYDKGDISCFAIDPTTPEESFHVGIIWSALRPNNPVPVPIDSNQSHQSQLEFYAAVLTELNFILKGDFTWKEQYKRYVDEESRKLVLVQQLDTKHPIYQKFVSGDLSWQKDLEEYIAKNN